MKAWLAIPRYIAPPAPEENGNQDLPTDDASPPQQPLWPVDTKASHPIIAAQKLLPLPIGLPDTMMIMWVLHLFAPIGKAVWGKWCLGTV